MRFFISILLIGIILTFLPSCYGGEEIPPCTTYRTSEVIGQYQLKSSNNFWIVDTSRTLQYSFNGNTIILDENKSFFKSRMIGVDKEEVFFGDCLETEKRFYVKSEVEEKVSNALDLPIYFIEERYKVYTGTNRFTDSIIFSSVNEGVSIKTNSYKYNIPIEVGSLNTCSFYPTIQLGSHSYDSVYYCTSENVNTKKIGKLYYKLGAGVLAFSIIENELWIRK